MSGAIARRLLTGGALLLAAFLAADAAEIDDDLPDLADQIGQMASEVALELQQICPPPHRRIRRPSTDAGAACSATRRCGAASRRDSCGAAAIRMPAAALKDTNLTQFAP